jgi:glycosyltransferase involved in cell wall biosynthesis
MIVCNEDRWTKFSLESVLPFAEKIFLYDTGSTDKTINIIKKMCQKNDKIIFEEKGPINKSGMVDFRNEQIAKTETDWFMILDGDEVYPWRIFDRLPFDEKYWGIFLRNYLCAGDVHHALPASYGKYELCGRKGHLNLRFYRKMKGWRWYGKYPLEYYGDENGSSLNKMCNKLYFLDDYYWHLSFLKRSSMVGRNYIKYHLGEKITGELPEIFAGRALRHRSISYITRSLFETPIRYLKNLVS